MRLVGIFCVVLPAIAFAESNDPFEALDQLLEAEFQATDQALEDRFQALDRALDEAFERARREIAESWGDEEATLPDKKRWIDYSEDLRTRRTIDFEQGVVEVAMLAEPDADAVAETESLLAAIDELVQSTSQDLAERDVVMQYAREKLAAESVDLVDYQADDSRPVLGNLVARPSPEKLDQAIAREELANGRQKVSVKLPLATGYQSTMASRFREPVMREAAQHDVAPSLMYAVIQTESSFNPRARSSVPAFGLMQLVPRSGAMDAYEYVYGEKELLAPEYLYDPTQNVELGAAYLKLLNTRYLRLITNPTSRKYCTIAAYNTGAGNVARAFVGTTNVAEAARRINAMTPDEVYRHLRDHLPYEETRRYLQKVLNAQQKFVPLDQQMRSS